MVSKIGNVPLVVVEIWLFVNIKLWLPVWTGSKGLIGVTFLVNIFLRINDLYNSAKIVNCTSCGCWDMIVCKY